MLEVNGLSAAYGQHRALDNVGLTVAPGEIVVILGANGAGKSTLLKALAGVCEGRTTGSVRLAGEEILGRPPDRIVEAGLALVPEGRGVFGDLTVQENLTLGAYPGRAREDEAANLDRVLRLFPKLVERRRQTVRTMSGGEQQMVAVGRAMMSAPAVLGLDEPSLGLSPILCRDLFESLAAVKRTGIGVLLVEQNAKQSLKIADRGYLLENGRIVHEGSAEALASDPAVQKAYLGAGGKAAPARPTATVRPMPQETAPEPARPAQPPRSRASEPPGDIAAAALRSATHPRRADRLTAALPPKSGSMPDTAELVSRASALASRRPNGASRAAPPATVPPATTPQASVPQATARQATVRPAPPSVTGLSADRLRAVLSEIEAAARRAETYRPSDRKR